MGLNQSQVELNDDPNKLDTPSEGQVNTMVKTDGTIWAKFPDGSIQQIGGGSGGVVGVVEVPLSLFQSGTNYYAKMASGFDVIRGDATGFEITQQAGALPDLIKSTEKTILRVTLIYYLQCITQTGNRRAFCSLFAGARATGGAVSPAKTVNNFRMACPLYIAAVNVNEEISSTLSWNGAGTLTLNGAKLVIEFEN